MMQHSPDRNGADLDVDEVFADRAFAASKARDAAFAVVRPATGTVVWANAAAAAHWGVGDAGALAEVLFGRDGRGGGWLDGIARGLVPGRAPRLARGGLAHGFRMRARTALIRAFAAGDGTVLLGFAVPEAMAAEAEPDAWRRPAWAADAVLRPAPAGEEAPRREEPGLSLARRSQVAVLRDRLGRAVDGAPTLRLLWRTDAAGTVTQVDADAFSRLGALLRFDRGTLPEAVAPFDLAAAARLRAALAARATWSGIVVDLPVADAAARLPMAMSGSPVFGPERLFAGFRGFCTLDLGRLELAPPPAEAAPAGSVGDEAPAEAPAPDAAAVVPAGPAPAAAGHEGAEALREEARPAALAAALPPANVVHLRAFQALAPGRSASPPSPAAGAAEPADPSSPTPGDPLEPAPPGDDLAFLALGEALRARIGALARPVPPADATPVLPAEATPTPLAPAGEAAAEEPTPITDAPGSGAETLAAFSAGLAERLPVPLIVALGSSPTFANAAAAARLNYPDAAALLRVGADVVAAPQADAVDLLDARHGRVTVPARRVAMAWGGDAATLWVLGEATEAAAAEAGASPADDEGRAADLLDRVDDAVALLDGQGLVRRLNRRGEAWFGPAGGLGQSFVQALAPESRPAALALLDEVRGQRDGLGAPPSRRDVLARTGEAAPVPMVLTLGRLGAAGFYLTLRDVAALKRAETERVRTERDHLRDAGRLPGLLGKVSHEIRTPLNAILGFAEVMMDERFGPLGNPRYRDYLKDIHASGVQVMTLVEDLLDLSRIEAGQLDLAVAPLDVNRIVAETVAQMQPEAHRERVIMRTSLGGRTPAVLADERSARQIVRNLLSNAVKFNEPGGQVIVSTALGDDGAVLLRVRDTGVGMTDDEIAAALEPFGGVASSQPAGGKAGNGLGLPLTRALVGANGASMAIRSRPREGTLVEVAFAAAAPDAARLPA